MDLEVISRLPEPPTSFPPLLFVHGAWHGAWCWDEHFLPYFAAQGFAAHALSLRGHGASPGAPHVRGLHIGQYVADLAAVAATLPAPPVVIGHSMGGLVVQKYLERHPAPAAVLLASVPPHGVVNVTGRMLVHHTGPFLLANLTTRLYPLVATPRLARDLFFTPGLPDADVRRYQQQMQDESYLGYLDMLLVSLPRPRRIRRIGQPPLLVLGAAHDHVFAPGEITATARAFGTTATIVPDIAHDMMLEPGWQGVADTIIAWLRERVGAAAA